MKKILLTLFILCFSTNSYSLNFNQNIYSYMNQNDGTVANIYILNRCSGITGYFYSMMSREPNGQDAANTFLRISTLMTNRATEIYRKHSKTSYQKSLQENMNRATRMSKLYSEDAKEMFTKTGSYLSGIVRDDMNFCTEFERLLQKK